MRDFETIELELVGPVARLTFNRPEVRNALNSTMWDELIAALAIVGDSAAKILVLTGAGPSFCAGADLKAFRSNMAGGGTVAGNMGRVEDVCRRLQELPVVTVTRLNGSAVGAGFSLAIGSDLVVAGRSATLRPGFAKVGVSLDTGSSWRLAKLVGLQHATRLVVLDELLSAERAQAIGLVSFVVDDDQLDAEIDRVTDRLLEMRHESVVACLDLLERSYERDLTEALNAETATTLALTESFRRVAAEQSASSAPAVSDAAR